MRARCTFNLQEGHRDGVKYWAIRARVRINGGDTTFKTGLEIKNKAHWKKGMVFGSERYLMDIYSKLKTIKEEVEAIPCTSYHTPQMVVQMYNGNFAGSKDIPVTLVAAVEYTKRVKEDLSVISQGTAGEYRSVISRLKKWLRDKGWSDIPLTALRKSHIRDYVDWLCEVNGTGVNATAYLHYIIINTSINYVLDDFSDIPELPKVNIIKGAIKKPDAHEAKMNSLKRTLPEDIVDAIWEVDLSNIWAVKGASNKMNPEWMRYTVLFQIYSGFSFVDLGHDNWSAQRDISGGDVIVLHRGKNAQEAFIPISEELKKVMEKLESFEGNRLFPFERFVNPMNYREKDEKRYNTAYANYNNFLKRLSKALFLKEKISTHMLRHTFAMRMINKIGMSLDSVRAMMGHSSITTTQTYATTEKTRVTEEYNERRRQIQKEDNTISIAGNGG